MRAMILALTLTITCAAVQVNSCNKSREYLLGGLVGDLQMTPQTYDGLFKVCETTATMPNVDDAFILKDGGIGVIAKRDTIPATAATLARFCDANPRATLRFISKKDLLLAKSMSKIVSLSSTGTTSCKKIKGLM